MAMMSQNQRTAKTFAHFALFTSVLKKAKGNIGTMSPAKLRSAVLESHRSF